MKRTLCILFAAMLLLGAAALADGYGKFSNGIYAAYSGLGFDGYMDIDGAYDENGMELRVISKSASIWEKPKTNSKKLGSAAHGEILTCLEAYKENGFYPIRYNGKEAYVNSEYVVRTPFQIVLMESNVPAYIAPDRKAKKVGSLAKLTRYDVIGMYDDFYIVNLRGAAAAFIPTDVAHYDTSFEYAYPNTRERPGHTTVKTALRAGPGYEYAEVETVKSGYEFDCVGVIDGWYALYYSSKSTDGLVIVYVDPTDAALN